eukprot:6212356-Pleurochrysis_carterae.AAC.3
MCRARGCPWNGSRDRIAPAELHESVLQERQQARSTRGRLCPCPLLVGNKVIQLPHESRRRLPAKMTEVNISCASASLRTFAKQTLKAALPRVMSAMRMKSTLHIASSCVVSAMAYPIPLMRA